MSAIVGNTSTLGSMGVGGVGHQMTETGLSDRNRVRLALGCLTTPAIRVSYEYDPSATNAQMP